MTVYLVPGTGGRHEIYSEPPEAGGADATDAGMGGGSGHPASAPDGRIRAWMRRARDEWHDIVERAQHGGSGGRLAQWRDRIVCSLAESIAEQRTLWALRGFDAATIVVPASLDAEEARAVLMAALGQARRHHLRWLVIDGLIFIVSGVLAVIPGPNVLAYYFLFRAIGHLQSWRGARQGMDRLEWTLTPDASLAELAALVDEPRERRGPRVDAIAERLQLPHLAAFFDRVALPTP